MGQDVGCSGLVVVKKQATILYLEEGRKSAQEPKTALEFLQQKNPLPKNGCKRGSSDVRQDTCMRVEEGGGPGWRSFATTSFLSSTHISEQFQIQKPESLVTP